MAARKVQSLKNESVEPEVQIPVAAGSSVSDGEQSGINIPIQEGNPAESLFADLKLAAPTVVNWDEFNKRQTPREKRRLYAEPPKGFKVCFASALNGQINPAIHQNLLSMGYQLVKGESKVTNDKSVAARTGAIYAPTARYASVGDYGNCWVVGDAVLMICREDMYVANNEHWNKVTAGFLGGMLKGRKGPERVADPSGRLSKEDPDGFTQVTRFVERQTTEPLAT